MAWHGVVWCGMAWRSEVWQALHGIAWHGVVWHGVARQSMMWHGMAWHGAAWVAIACHHRMRGYQHMSQQSTCSFGCTEGLHLRYIRVGTLEHMCQAQPMLRWSHILMRYPCHSHLLRPRQRTPELWMGCCLAMRIGCVIQCTNVNRRMHECHLAPWGGRGEGGDGGGVSSGCVDGMLIPAMHNRCRTQCTGVHARKQECCLGRVGYDYWM